MPAMTVMIKPVSGSCDLQCDYCFYRDETKNRTTESYGAMELDTLEEVLKKVLSYADGECTIAYQGGEPTLRGLEFYRKSLEFQEQYNVKKVKINNAIQTNGYGINEEWAAFLGRNHFLTGLSLDGTKKTHDLYRKNVRQEGSFHRIMETIRLLEKYEVEFNILTVVHKYTAAQVDRIYKFYQKNHLDYLQFIPCLDPLGELAGGREYSLTPEAYGTFLMRLFDLWYEDVKTGCQPYIRQFENILGMLLGMAPEACDQRGICGMQYVVEADGAVYPCDFYVLDEYRLGSLKCEDMEALDRKRKDIRFIETSMDFPDECKSCRMFYLCRGGCRRHRCTEDGKNYFCPSYRQFYTYTMKRWECLAREVVRQNESMHRKQNRRI